MKGKDKKRKKERPERECKQKVRCKMLGKMKKSERKEREVEVENSLRMHERW